MPEKESEKREQPHVEAAPAAQPSVIQLPATPPRPQSTSSTGTVFESFKLSAPIDQPDRDPAGATVLPTGLTRTNTAGYLLIEDTVEDAGLDQTNFAFLYGINKEKRQVALYPVHPSTPGAAPVRRDQERMIFTIYLKPVFQAYKELRVASRQQVTLYPDVDSSGRECVVLALNIALDKPVNRREKTDGE